MKAQRQPELAVVADVALPALRGRYPGAYGLCFGLAAFAAPLIGAGVIQGLGAHVLWLACLGAALAVALGHIALEPHLTRLRAARVAAR